MLTITARTILTRTILTVTRTLSSIPDVAIVGGGIIGCATARELIIRQPDLKIVLLEKETAPGEIFLLLLLRIVLLLLLLRKVL